MLRIPVVIGQGHISDDSVGVALKA